MPGSNAASAMAGRAGSTTGADKATPAPTTAVSTATASFGIHAASGIGNLASNSDRLTRKR
jgi:hypothetical protein